MYMDGRCFCGFVDSLASWIVGVWVVGITVWSAGRDDAVAGATWCAIVWSSVEYAVDGGGEDAGGEGRWSPGAGEWGTGWMAIGRADALLAYWLVVLLLVRSKVSVWNLEKHGTWEWNQYDTQLPGRVGSLQTCWYRVGWGLGLMRGG